VYVDEGYVDVGYQHYTGKFIAATTHDMTFEPLAFEPTGLQLPISAEQVVIRHEFHDGGATEAVNSLIAIAAPQIQAIRDSWDPNTVGRSPSDVMLNLVRAEQRLNAAINQTILDHPSWIEIELAPVQKISADVEYDALVGPLVIPMQVNLAAPSTP
jgi:hypothetical protein